MHVYKGFDDDTAQVLFTIKLGSRPDYIQRIYEKLKIRPTKNPFSCD